MTILQNNKRINIIIFRVLTLAKLCSWDFIYNIGARASVKTVKRMFNRHCYIPIVKYMYIISESKRIVVFFFCFFFDCGLTSR